MHPVGKSPDLERIRNLPGKAWGVPPNYWTSGLRRPGSQMRLWKQQELALWEAKWAGGLVGILPVGSGKTLLSALLPTAMDAIGEAVILTEGGLVSQEQADVELYRDHWVIDPDLRWISYSKLQRDDGALEELAPRLIIANEAHTLGRRNLRAKVVRRYLRNNPDTAFVALSGSLLQRSLMDLCELFSWALRDGSPLPRRYNAASEWAEAVDPPGYPNFQRRPPGALSKLMLPGETLHDAIARTISNAPGVVVHSPQSCDKKLTITRVDVPTCEKVREALRAFKKTWELPNGHRMNDPMQAARAERQLALGYYTIGDRAEDVAWLSLAAPLWLKGFARDPLVIWVDSLALGEFLQAFLGAPFYAAGGSGILNEKGDRAIVAMVQSHGTGRNLQAFSSAINFCWLGGGAQWEQLIGRLHRGGQTKPVNWYFLKQYQSGFNRARRESRWLQQMLGGEQKVGVGS